MLRRSIPEYDEMRLAVAAIAARFAKDGTTVLDLGCSRGEALATVRDWVASTRPGLSLRYWGAEISEPMVEAARERFAGYPDVLVGQVDLRRGFPPVQAPGASVVLSVLTLQFVPVNYRQDIVEAAFEAMVPGGVLILVEKVLGQNAALDRAFVDLYHGLKGANGYSEDEVVRKAAALEGVLVPLTAAWNEGLLRTAGFAFFDVFWAWMNFRGWVAVK